MKTSSAKAKGRKFQQWCRDLLLKHAPGLTSDDVRSTSMGAGGEDILLSTAARAIYPWTVECKAQERLNIWKAWDQAVENRPNEAFEPIVFITKNRQEPLVVMRAGFFMNRTVQNNGGVTMEFKNEQDLPGALHQFLTYNDYNLGGPKFDVSATKLMDSPQIAKFWKEHGRDVVEDSSTRLYSSMGSGIHSRFEAANASNADVMMEKRFLWGFPHPTGMSPLTVSAQIDAYDFKTKTLADLKTVSSWKLVHGDYAAFERQLNIGAYLMGKNGFQIDALQVYALCRDWSKGRQGERNYPMQPIQVIDIDMWTEAQQFDYITERLAMHFGEGEKSCSDSERWMKPGSYAVKDKSKKRALRVLKTQEQADNWIAAQGLTDKKGISVDVRPATYMRCDNYCAFGTMGVCSQYNSQQENKGG